MAHDHADHEESPEQLEVRFEQLSLLESEFEDAEAEVSKSLREPLSLTPGIDSFQSERPKLSRLPSTRSVPTSSPQSRTSGR